MDCFWHCCFFGGTYPDFLPQKSGYSIFLISIAGGHIVLALLVLTTGWILIPQRFFSRILKRRKVEGYDFGWTPKWIYGFALGSTVAVMMAIHLYFSLEFSQVARLLIYSLLLLVAVNLFIAYILFQNSRRQSQITLPMVPFVKEGTVLDAGCGAGRTTIALSHAIPGIKIVAFDKFDADYIDQGGKDLLLKNIKYAGVEKNVSIVNGDITATPFDGNQFDAIISSYMFDHLGSDKQKALEEAYRILKPGGRFLLIVVIRGYTMFGIANVLSFLLPSRVQWIKWIEQTGFKMISDGNINEGAYFCFEKS